MRNPFPGLRPFESDEEHLFFGREAETDDLLRRLRTTRFLAVVGSSGSGKSSLVRSGLIPSLQAGFMAGAGSTWRIATQRPGEDPIGLLAGALSRPDVLGGAADEELAATQRVLVEASLRRGTRGLVEAVRLARLPSDQNVLILVDQFEELFRFGASRVHGDARDEAIAFVRLLLEATRQHDLPIYVVVTMRSDFISECAAFPGLAEAVNAGLYLVGRMGREALRSAIVGPVAVGGGTIAPRLVHHVLNDVDDDRDQLPLVQHALMRTWDRWVDACAGSRPMDLEDYAAVGGVREALSRHAEEAWREAEAAGRGTLAMRVFRALTDTVSDARGIRRPTSIGQLAAISEAPEADVISVVDVFRRAGRSFLMPPSAWPLSTHAIVDISHESLMRCWRRLMDWAEEERVAAAFYVRLAQAATWHAEGTAGLWRDPELALALRWRRDTHPTEAWARRYDDRFSQAMAFLDASRQAHDDEEAARQAERRARLRRAQVVAAVLAVLLVVAVVQAWRASRANARAEANLALARAAVDESLSAAEGDPAAIGADVPALEEFRRELLEKAQTFYEAILAQQPDTEEGHHDVALALMRVGHIDRLLQRRDAAAARYREAIARFDALVAAHPARAAYRQGLAAAHSWLGETLRPVAAAADEAGRAYDEAARLQRALLTDRPDRDSARRDLARTLYNRAIFEAEGRGRVDEAERDVREAIGLLETIEAREPEAAHELARACNNLAGLLVARDVADARRWYARAIAIEERLLAGAADSPVGTAVPAVREYQLQLATIHNNQAALAFEQGDPAAAETHSARAVAVLADLARLPPSLGVERADAFTLRGVILEARDPEGARQAWRQALEAFTVLGQDPRARALPAFHVRLGELITTLAGSAGGRADLDSAVATYESVAQTARERAEATAVALTVETLGQIAPRLPDPFGARLFARREQLRLKH